MQPDDPSTQAVARHAGREAKALIKAVPPYCGVWWRWGPFLLVIMFSCLAAGLFLRDVEASVHVMPVIVAPLLILMFLQLIIFANGLGWGAFAFALLRLFIACGIALVCQGRIMAASIEAALD